METIQRIDFREAVKAIGEERRRALHAHATLEELDAYHRGGLPASRQEAIAEHLSVCEDCSILTLYAVIGAQGNGEGLDTSDAEIEEAWSRLQPHLRNGSPAGQSLANLLAEGSASLDEVLKLTVEISRALEEHHSASGLLHDLRAENVLVSPSGQVRFLDLGIAPTPESFEAGYGRPAGDALVDLYRATSPEQVVGERLDQRSNLFSLGVLFYEMLTGVSPFRDSTPLSTASRILSLDPLPARDLNPQIEPALSELIDRLLAKDPEGRSASASEVVRRLRVILGTSGAAEESPSAESSAALEEEIEDLYDRIIELTRDEGVPEPDRDEEIERAYARLRSLQQAEAEQFRERFEASLNMPIDAGEQILARARALREELEDLTSSHSATRETDEP